MSNVNDAFATPKSNVTGATLNDNPTGITEEIIKQLKRTYPWVSLLSTLGFIATIVGIMVMVEVFLADDNVMLSKSIATVIPNTLILLSNFFVSLYLFKYAKSIKRVVNSNSITDLEIALQYQASFWKLIGILFLLVTIIMLGGIIASIIMAK